MNILITGGTRGIGESLVRAFCWEHHTAFFCYEKNSGKAAQLEEEMKSRGLFAKGFQADVADGTQILSMVKEIQNRYGRIDVLVNNAGIAMTKLFQDVSEDEWNRIFDVNVKGAYHCIKAVLPEMIRGKSGRIINISSVWGVTGASLEAAYSASKAALIGLTKALAKELGPSGITVNCIAPGVINTDMNRCYSQNELAELINETPAGRLGTGEDVAALALFLAGEKASFVTGQIISADGGFAM